MSFLIATVLKYVHSFLKMTSLVLSTFSDGELEQLPQFREVMDKLDEKLSEDCRFKCSVEEMNKLEQKAESSTSAYVANLILYHCLQSISAGNLEDGCEVPENIRSQVSESLCASELNFFKESFPDKSVHNSDLIASDDLHERSSDFDAIVSKCVASQLENAVSTLLMLSGERDKAGLERLIDRIISNSEEINNLERARCKLTFAYTLALSDYVQTLYKCCDELFFTDELPSYEATVDLLLAKAEALLLKARVLELQIHCAIYTKEKVQELKDVRNGQMQVRGRLERDIDELKAQIESYESVGGPDFASLVMEYGKVRDEIDQQIWALKEFSSDNDNDLSSTTD